MKKLIELIEQFNTLLNQEIVTLKNEFVLYRIKVEKLETKLEELMQQRASKTSYIVALIAAAAAITVGVIELYKK